tara:strand:- start:254 stop:895 length:642 start_codon:yes stop_codon:yes gene_type:complete
MDSKDNLPTPCAGIRIGDMAPNFSARSTLGPIELADYRDRWVILFSHPADFTPVCTTEFVAMAQEAAAFEERNCALIGLSVDSLFSHFAWLRAIRDRFGVEVRFPLVEDPSMAIGHAFGMLAPGDSDSATVRSLFFIDPRGVVRATTCYPANVGRSISEMLRTLDALQAVDRDDRLAPANWQKGGPLLHPVPTSLDEVYGAEAGGGWFLREEG